MRTTSLVLVASLLVVTDASARKKKIAIAVGGFSCTGAELEGKKVELVPVQDPSLLEQLGRCDKAKCWKKIVRKLKADVAVFGTMSEEGGYHVTRALWLDPGLGEPDVLLALHPIEAGDFSPCGLLAAWLPYLDRGYACHQKKCDPKRCVRHVYSNASIFGSEPLWKSTRLAEDGLCVDAAGLLELCKPLSCDCLMENEDSLAGFLGSVTGCETSKRLVRLKIDAPQPASDGL